MARYYRGRPRTRRATKRKTKTRSVVRYRGRNLRTKTNLSLGLGFPKKVTMAHKYSENITLVSSTGALKTYQYSCNGMYDPNITGTGHQPFYYDQLSALYNHYCVIGSKIKLTFVPQDSVQVAFAVALYVDDDTSITYTDPSQVPEFTTGKYRMINCDSTDTVGVMTDKWSARKYFGKGVLANTDLQGALNINPNEQSYYTILMRSLSGVDTVSVQVHVEIEYIAVWKELKDITGS